ncbi:MAG: tRNA (adenosine(37)-N6)-threonylcarbamoyltransferase complex ATPase subunit type 1 TsaE [Eubacteriaceae bacterium]|jgi:tRNA threonylcarbamoyladenosine biosynthesis protein TsaE|nr:tRNA (adenosine(37)-N6)-threonylcarbamoyltransferase complex ATPase subunit type 1 TsaE [Eubacteriaceae bacterium]
MELERKEIFFSAQDESATAYLGGLVGRSLPKGSLVALIGPMASGKTAISRAIFQARGFDRGFSSPTYTIINRYLQPCGKVAYHIDASRLESEWELYVQGFADFLEEADIVVVEWADAVMGVFGEGDIFVLLKTTGETSRDICVRSANEAFVCAVSEGLRSSGHDPY